MLLLQAASASPLVYWVWAVVLGSGLLSLVSLSRAGSALFWRTAGTPGGGEPTRAIELAPVVALLGSAAVLVALAAPLDRYTQATADQLLDRTQYVDAVLGNDGVSTPASQREGAK